MSYSLIGPNFRAVKAIQEARQPEQEQTADEVSNRCHRDSDHHSKSKSLHSVVLERQPTTAACQSGTKCKYSLDADSEMDTWYQLINKVRNVRSAK